MQVLGVLAALVSAMMIGLPNWVASASTFALMCEMVPWKNG